MGSDSLNSQTHINEGQTFDLCERRSDCGERAEDDSNSGAASTERSQPGQVSQELQQGSSTRGFNASPRGPAYV